MFKTKYLSKQALANLKEYKYKSGEYSILDNMLTPFWNWFVTFIPMWLAPNLVTLLGLFLMFGQFMQFAPYDLALKQEFSPYTNFICAYALFMYQTLDAVDGKQARRTGQSGPLGQLFDHGCDAWSTVFLVHVILQVFRMGPDSLPFYVYTAGGLAIFYTGNWEEYHCEIMRTSMYGFGVTEMHWICITLLCINGGTNNGLSKLTLGDVTGLVGVDPKGYGDERIFPNIFAMGNGLVAIGVLNNLYTVFTSKKHSFAHQFVGILPLFMIIAYYYTAFNYTQKAWDAPVTVLFTVASFYSMCASRMIIGSVTHTTFSVFDDLHLSLPFIFGIIIFPLNNIYGLGISEDLLFISLFWSCLFMYFWYICNAIMQITEFMDIWCLVIKHPKKQD